MAESDYRRLAPVVGALLPGRVVEGSCAVCTLAFDYLKVGPGRERKFCSEACGAKRAQRRDAVADCPTCGRQFRPRHGGGQRVCSLACRRWPERRIYPTDRERFAAAADRRRAQKRGAGYERFLRREIYERDGWLCKLCGDPVDRTGEDKHLRPSLDHIVPLARGGQHNRGNVQCAHWVCNSRKSHWGT